MSRIVLCLPLLMVDAMTVPFWVLYVIAGLTDILDGFLARRWGVSSEPNWIVWLTLCLS